MGSAFYTGITESLQCVLQVPSTCLFLFDQSDTIFLALSLSLSKPKFPISSISDQKAWNYQVKSLYNYSYSFKSKLILNETVGLSQIKQNKNQRLVSIKKKISLSEGEVDEVTARCSFLQFLPSFNYFGD